MQHLVVAYPRLSDGDEAWVRAMRERHDPHAALIDPHFTLVFPAALDDPAALLIDPGLVTLEPLVVEVETGGLLSSGMTLMRSPQPDGPPPAQVALNVQVARFEQFFVERVAAPL
jgi:hypothetical protein